MSSRSPFQQSLRRLKPEKHPKRLVYRDREQLPFVSALQPPYPKLLLDTTVYIDALQGRLSEQVEIVLRAGEPLAFQRNGSGTGSDLRPS